MVHPDKRTLERVLRQMDIRAGLSLLPEAFILPQPCPQYEPNGVSLQSTPQTW